MSVDAPVDAADAVWAALTRPGAAPDPLGALPDGGLAPVEAGAGTVWPVDSPRFGVVMRGYDRAVVDAVVACGLRRVSRLEAALGAPPGWLPVGAPDPGRQVPPSLDAPFALRGYERGQVDAWVFALADRIARLEAAVDERRAR